jgi:leader peptidase (prepilin peptidase)/N-methyltransferase
LLGYAMLRGRCRTCKKGISFRYPMVEFLTGLLFVASALKYGWGPFLFVRDWPFLLILVAVTFIDLDHRIIPDQLSLGGLVLGLLTCWLDPRISVIQSVLGAVIGFGVFYSLAWVYQRTTGKSGLGGGDIKLLAMFGAFLGPSGVFCVILISSIAGSLIGIGWALALKYRAGNPGGAHSEVMGLAIPYGPFLVLGGLYYYLMGDILWLQFTIPT